MTVRKRLICGFTAFLLMCLVFSAGSFAVYADEKTSSDIQGLYNIIIQDDADLLTEEEEADLYEHMAPVTRYGHAGFYSTNGPVDQTSSYARDAYTDFFGQDSGTLFLIDMDNRYLYIFSRGAVEDAIPTSIANTITDNVYRLAGKGDYAGCAMTAFDQIGARLEGQKIAQPMKHITNLLTAIILAMAIGYGFIRFHNMKGSPDRRVLVDALTVTGAGLSGLNMRHTGTTRTYSPPSSSSGSGGGSSGGGGGGGGGGGSGGGHGF